jgi:hypothetical protein
MPGKLYMFKGGALKPKTEIKNLLRSPIWGEASIFHARAPINDDRKKGTRLSGSKIPFHGQFVRAAIQARSVPIIPANMDVHPAIISVFLKASTINCEVNTST